MFTKVITRLIDVVFSLVILTIFSPLMLVIGLSIFILDRGCLFAENSQRIGKNGKKFDMYKFRSMIPNAHQAIQNDKSMKDLKKKWIVQDKLPIDVDPRITFIGRLIRRCDIDELPQFFNVLKGEMSVVGPRPWFTDELERNLKKYPQFKNKFYNEILSVKPGVTGWWQVNGRNKNTIRRRFELDLQYVRKKNVFLDMKIILKTPFVILKQILFKEEYAK